MRPPRIPPTMLKNTKSSTSFGFHVELGFAARRRASHQPAAKPSRYMMPYQCTLIGPIWKATLLNPGKVSMRRGSLADRARHAAEVRLEIACFRYGRMYRVVRGLAARLQDLYKPSAVTGGGLDRVDKFLGAQVIRAGTGHEQSLIGKYLQGELVELAVRRLALRDVFLTLDERRWIQHHDVEAPALAGQLFQRIEGIGAQRVDHNAVAPRIRLRKIQGRLG